MIKFTSAKQCVAVIAVTSTMLLGLSGCVASRSQLDEAKASGAQQQAQQDDAKKQKDEQASLKSQIKTLQQAEAKRAKESAAAKTAAAKKKKTTSSNPGSGKTASSKKKAASDGSSGGATCGGSLSVGSNTTCGFASNVESDYYAAGGGYTRFDSYSPVTNRWYLMTCVPGVPTVCRGGNHAIVYIR